MKFEYCCFVSYPHGQDNEMVPLVKDFVTGLRREINLLTRLPTWVDFLFLEAGSRQNHKIGPALCKTACMILIYTPLYLDSDHLYCAQELQAMRKLEAERLDRLSDKGDGLIIPIVLRGKKYFPKSLSSNGIYYDFENIVNSRRHNIADVYDEDIKKIAAYIYDRCRALADVELPEHDCNKYALPTPEEAKKFVDVVLERPVSAVAVPFPSRVRRPPRGGKRNG